MDVNKFGLVQQITQPTTFGPLDIAGDLRLSFVVENAQPSNVVKISARINEDSTYDLLAVINGSGSENVNVSIYDEVLIECTVFSSLSNIVNILGSGFGNSEGTSIKVISVGHVDIQDASVVEFESTDSSIAIIPDPIFNKIDFKINSSFGNSFGVVHTPDGTNVAATSSTDTLTLTSTNSELTITGNALTESVDFKISQNAVDASKIRLNNDTYLRARNNANTADVSILKVNSSDVIQFNSVPEVSSDPISVNALVRKSYVDNLLTGLKWKEPVIAASVANVPILSGLLTIDNVPLQAENRVLLKDQLLKKENGIYIVKAGTWVRSQDANSEDKLINACLFVEKGDVNADRGFVCISDSINVGVDPIEFIQFTSAGSFYPGDGISIVGSTVSVNLASIPGLEFDTSKLKVKADPAGAISVGSSGIAVKLEASNPSLEISGLDELGVKLNPSGALIKGVSGLSAQVDNITTKINASNKIEGLKDQIDAFSLSSTDIANQYVDLTKTASSVYAVEFIPQNGPIQLYTIDYGISLTGGSGGVTRITFLGDLATGGACALEVGEVIAIKYRYL